MNVSKEIKVLCECLELSETELANNLGVTYETVNNWKNNRKSIDEENLEKLYSFAHNQGIRFNFIYEQFYKEDLYNENEIVLFHGSKNNFAMPIDFKTFSKKTNDFGVGFYLGETFEQAANYISFLDRNYVYCFKLNLNKLKIYKFDVNTEWMIAIAYFRGWLDEYRNSFVVKKILNKIDDVDIIIAPIADNRMFDIIADFVEGNITDEQCKHSLAATNLGSQYVIKTEKGINNLYFVKEMYVCTAEKNSCIEKRLSLADSGIQKSKIARLEYKCKGKYIGEILK